MHQFLSQKQKQELLLFLCPAVNSSSSFMLSSTISTHQVKNFIHHHFYQFLYGTGRKIQKKLKTSILTSYTIYQNQKFPLVGGRGGFPLTIEKKSTRNIKNKTLICFKKINILFLIACYRSPLKNLGSIFHSMWLE